LASLQHVARLELLHNEHEEDSWHKVTPQVSGVLDKALTLSTHDRGLLIVRLIESLDEAPADEGVGKAWAEEIQHRVNDIRSGKVEMIPGEEVRRRLAARLLNGPK